MTNMDVFKNKKTLVKAEVITPPNLLKQKVGSGGIHPKNLSKAKDFLENNTIDFKPLATKLLQGLHETILNGKNNILRGEAAIESMLHPAVQLKAQGSLFHFPLISEIADLLVNFLESVSEVNAHVFEIVSAHEMAISAIIHKNMSGTTYHPQGQALKTSLIDACARYYKTEKNK